MNQSKMDHKTLTSVNQITLKELEDYSESYAAIGHIVVDLDIAHKLHQHIAILLPNNYKVVNLGSGNGNRSQKIIQACRRMGKSGIIINVDPYMTKQDVLKITSQQYMQKCQSQSLDLALCQCSFHFNRDQKSFFKNIHRCLKYSGKFVILQMGNEVVLPWTPALQSNFLKLLLLANDFIPADLFQWKLQKEIKKVRFNKEQFREFVKNRSWSNLLTNSQEQIDECIHLIDSKKELPEAILSIWVFTIEKKRMND